MKASFWFMRDNHTFKRLRGNTVDEIARHAKITAKLNPYGMVCPATLIHNGKSVRRVGKGAHVNGKGQVNLIEWRRDLKADKQLQIL